MDGLGCSLPIDFYAALPSLLLSTLSVVKNLLMLAGMPLKRRDILYCPVIAFGVVAVNEGSNQAFQLMECEDVLEAQPVVFECPEKGFDPGVVRGCLISGKQLRTIS